MKSTEKTTRIPATAPMMNAAAGLTNAHGAVIATNPASKPLQSIEGSGLPNLSIIAV